jgi:hypothetical protein
MEVKYTGFISDGQIVVHSVKSDLTPALGMYGWDPLSIAMLTQLQLD